MKSFLIATLVALCAFAIATGDEPTESPVDLKSRVDALEATVARLEAELSVLKRERTTASPAHPIAEQLNGRWRYVTATEGETVTQYDELEHEIVINGTKWTTLVSGAYMDSDTHTVEYNFGTKPVSLVRTAPKRAPNSIAKAILKIHGDQLIYTTTAFEDPSKRYPGSADTLHQYPQTPAELNPKGTRNIKYVLRRVSRSTTLPRLQPFGGGDPGF